MIFWGSFSFYLSSSEFDQAFLHAFFIEFALTNNAQKRIPNSLMTSLPVVPIHLNLFFVCFFFHNQKSCELVIFSQYSKLKNGYRVENGSADLVFLFIRFQGMLPKLLLKLLHIFVGFPRKFAVFFHYCLPNHPLFPQKIANSITRGSKIPILEI